MNRRVLGTLALGAPSLLGSAGCGVRLRQPGSEGTAGSPAGSGGTDREGSVPRLDVETAFAEVRAGRAVLIDVRGAGSFGQRRAAGAISVPLDEIERSPKDAIARLTTEKRPVLYCT